MINGIINVYKEAGYTSHDVVAKLRGMVHQKKIGHTGTLDPDAEGVLPVCLGKATRVCDSLTDETKTYEAVLLLGRETDTQDTSGTTLREREVTCTEDQVREVLASFVGEQMQVPPMYSALKVNGKKLYELARQGKVIEREARKVTFFEIQSLSFDLPKVTVRVTCSKGTYIRTLCNDVGEKLGCGGCMAHLTRTRVGRFREQGALKLSRIQEMIDQGRLNEVLTSVDIMFDNLTAVATRQSGDALAYNGNKIPFGQVSNLLGDRYFGLDKGLDSEITGSAFEEDQYRVYDSVGHFIGVFRTDRKAQMFVPDKMFFDPDELKQQEKPYEKYVKAEGKR